MRIAFAELLFQQVPLLRIDGIDLVQSGAIARYLARKTHLYGDTDIEAAQYVSADLDGKFVKLVALRQLGGSGGRPTLPKKAKKDF